MKEARWMPGKRTNDFLREQGWVTPGFQVGQ